MSRNTQKATAITLFLLVSTLLLATFSAARAQTIDQAVVLILPSTGGTTDPVPGNYTYNNGDVFNMTAVPSSGFQFSYWIISGAYAPGHTSGGIGYITDPDTGAIIQLPTPISTAAIDSLVVTKAQLNITCGFGYTYNYQAVFTPIGGPSPVPSTTDAVVIVMPTTGGTVTPAAGSHTYSNGTVIDISATPASGYKFSYWLVSGSNIQGHTTTQISTIVDDNGNIIAQIPKPSVSGIDSITFTANPAHITCGYGYTYTYTAIFEPVSATTSPTPTTTPVATQTPATPTPVTTSTPAATPEVTPTPISTGGIDTWVIAAVAVVIIIIIIAVVAVMMMRRKK